MVGWCALFAFAILKEGIEMLKTNVEKRAFAIMVQQGKKVWEQVVVAESEEAAKLICQSKGWNMLSKPKQA